MGGLPFFIKVFEMRGSGSESHRARDARGGEGEKSFLPKKASPPLLLFPQLNENLCGCIAIFLLINIDKTIIM